MLPRAGHAVVDLLQERHVRIAVLDRFDDPSQVISPVDAADAFVDVVAQQAEVHAAAFRGSIRAAVSASQFLIGEPGDFVGRDRAG